MPPVVEIHGAAGFPILLAGASLFMGALFPAARPVVTGFCFALNFVLPMSTGFVGEDDEARLLFRAWILRGILFVDLAPLLGRLPICCCVRLAIGRVVTD